MCLKNYVHGAQLVGKGAHCCSEFDGAMVFELRHVVFATFTCLKEIVFGLSLSLSLYFSVRRKTIDRYFGKHTHTHEMGGGGNGAVVCVCLIWRMALLRVDGAKARGTGGGHF